MIEVTRLNGEVFVINADLIETVEARPDTVLFLVNGRRYVVRESVSDVVGRVVAFRRSLNVPRGRGTDRRARCRRKEGAAVDLATLIGLLLAVILVIGGIVVGGEPGAFVNFPSLLVTVGGTFGATIMANPMERIRGVGKVLRRAFFAESPDLIGLVQTLVSFAEKARREGLLALEDDTSELDDQFLRKSIQLVVDGTDPELVKGILDTEIGLLEDRHAAGKQMFDTMAELAPAFGMLGTLIGLIQMLRNLSDPDALGPGMAVALITTFYGSFLANVICIPVSRKLAVRSAEEVLSRELMVEGVLAIQAGENPRIVEEKLKVFLPPQLRDVLDEEKNRDGKGEER
ncbi:flagellar FlbD family protein [Aminithiophilus ramosus]|uniref:Flagellar FlbD family protein n=1 Tax=Aminithiophilus ramosus TaxID=3029084 RepID=A0A9Q7EWI8_9BACT|nr:flagellar FlbD family protein [Aminithiophilus ramosus]QTX31660.1 flagellar FlbD family protein [Aminithiophilus ramosus]